MKELNGRELAGFLQASQARRVRQLRARKVFPHLAIFYDNDSPVIAKYMAMKQRYGEELGVTVDISRLTKENAAALLQQAADDAAIQGMIVQLPLAELGEEVLELIPPSKDVDGLRGGDTATALAVHWLLNGYGVELTQQKIAIVGHGKLVGAPLARMWQESGYDVTVFDKGDDLAKLIDFDVIVTATGVPGLIKPEMLKDGATVVDAGTASEGGVIRGDLDEAVRETRNDLNLTPRLGGVGPMTVAMLFEQLLQRCEK